MTKKIPTSRRDAKTQSEILRDLAELREISPPELALAAGLSQVSAEKAVELLRPTDNGQRTMDNGNELVKSAGILLIRLHTVLCEVDRSIELAPSIEALRNCPIRTSIQLGKEKIGQWIALETVSGLLEEMSVEMREDAEVR